MEIPVQTVSLIVCDSEIFFVSLWKPIRDEVKEANMMEIIMYFIRVTKFVFL